MRKAITLIAGQHGSRHFGTEPYLGEALALARDTEPVALYIGAANGDNQGFGDALGNLLVAAGADRVLWPKLTRRRRARVELANALDTADFVFVGGGDVEAGMRALRDADLVPAIRAAAERGAVFAGMSAGAIMIGERWIRWPDGHDDDTAAETYECLGLAPCSLDVHGEGDDWQEARSFAAVRARELGAPAQAYAVPSGGALVVAQRGKMHARGMAIPVFAARPGKEAEIEMTLKAER